MRIGFIGLGQMGQAMAGRLLDAGHELAVYNRSPQATVPFRARGARIARSPVEVLDAEVVVTMLADDAAVEAVWITPDLAGRMPASALHLNMATIGLSMGRRMAERHAKAGSSYVAAPVFGRPHVAATGALEIVAAGPAPAIARCAPLFDVLGSRTFVVGEEPHLANAIKIARNFLLASLVESLGEAFALVRKSGADPATFLDVIGGTSFDRRYRDYGRKMVEKSFESTFSLKGGLKDVELVLAAAADGGLRLPTAELIREQHLAAITDGFGEQDWAALGEFIARRAGLA